MGKVEAILQIFPGRFSKATRITEESFASEVYLVESATEQRILKCAHNEAKYWRELRTLDFLKDHISVPAILEAVHPAPDFRGAFLMNRLAGRPLAAESIDRETVRACGRWLADLHSIPVEGLGSFQREGFERSSFGSWWAYRRDLIFGPWTRSIEGQIDAAILGKIHQAFSKYFEILQDTEICCLHADFRFGNILAENGQIIGLIDFESSRTGDPSYDFIKIYEALQSQPNLWNEFLDGYSERRSLPDLEKTLPYYELDLNFGFLQWAVLRNEKELFQQRLSKLVSLLR